MRGLSTLSSGSSISRDLEKHAQSISLLYSEIVVNSKLYPEIDLDSLQKYFETAQRDRIDPVLIHDAFEELVKLRESQEVEPRNIWPPYPETQDASTGVTIEEATGEAA